MRYLIILGSFFVGTFSYAIVQCEPFGEFVQLSTLTQYSIHFLQVDGEPKVKDAEINTPNCKATNFYLDQRSYIDLQELTASATPAFVILRKIEAGRNCLVGIRRASDILSQTWIASQDDCFKQHLVQLRSPDHVSRIYVNSDQAARLASRKPAAAKAKKK